jgi:hypothetical protein
MAMAIAAPALIMLWFLPRESTTAREAVG